MMIKAKAYNTCIVPQVAYRHCRRLCAYMITIWAEEISSLLRKLQSGLLFASVLSVMYRYVINETEI